jgi:hypothetical protein
MEGSQLASKFHHAEAIPHYTRALALKPGTAEALALRCQSYHETGDDELATKDCEAAIEADSQQPLGYRFRAAIAMERGNCKAALLDIAPEEATVLHHDHEHRMPVKRIAVGEIVRVKPGERIPCDGELVTGESTVDESIITGEAASVQRTTMCTDTRQCASKRSTTSKAP